MAVPWVWRKESPATWKMPRSKLILTMSSTCFSCILTIGWSAKETLPWMLGWWYLCVRDGTLMTAVAISKRFERQYRWIMSWTSSNIRCWGRLVKNPTRSSLWLWNWKGASIAEWICFQIWYTVRSPKALEKTCLEMFNSKVFYNQYLRFCECSDWALKNSWKIHHGTDLWCHSIPCSPNFITSPYWHCRCHPMSSPKRYKGSGTSKRSLHDQWIRGRVWRWNLVVSM